MFIKKQNLTLIGLPGSGKSTIGKLLGADLKFDWVDTDVEMSNKIGLSLNDFIKENGYQKFLKEEEETLANMVKNKTVISTGGSAIYSKVGMENLKKQSIIIYLKADIETIMKRLGDSTKRGIVVIGDKSIKETLKDRIQHYENWADIIIETDTLSISSTLSILKTHLHNNLIMR